MTATLMVATELPLHPLTGGRMRTLQLAQALARLGPVTIAGFTLGGERASPAGHGWRAAGVPWTPPPLYSQMQSSDTAVSARAYETLAFQVREPWSASCYESPRLHERIRRLCAERVDMVVIEHSLMGAYLDDVPATVPTVLDLHNLHAREAMRAAAREREDPREARRVREFERSLIERCTITLAVSELEAQGARELAPSAHVEVVPNGVDTDFFAPSAMRPTDGYMLFTGLMNFAPNVEAVRWFAAEILPRIDRGCLHVVGARPSEEVWRLAGERVLVHGEVPDTRPFQREAQVVVVPLRSGAGTRLKLLEAAACGNAIVSSTLGAEGLDFRPGRDLLVADTPAEFASAVRSVLDDHALRSRLGEDARRAAERYRWEAIGERLLKIVGSLVGGTDAG